MKIEIWSDIACPFCYIGKKNLEAALETSPFKENVNIEYKSFQLDPNAPPYDGGSYINKLIPKFGSEEKAKQFLNHLTQQAANAGLDFQLDSIKATNTLDAHRLIHWAKTHGKEQQLKEKLLYAYFTESKDVGDITTLADIAETCGLNRDEAISILQDKGKYKDEVRGDQQEAAQYGISGVPYFVINQKYAVSGAQPVKSFSEVLEKVWQEENPSTKLEILSSEVHGEGVCSDEGCVLPDKR